MYEIKPEDVDFIVEDDGLRIIDYKANETNIAFPDTFKIGSKKYPIVAIDVDTFKNFKNLESVVCPSDLIHIESCVFMNQEHLKEVSLGKKTIGIEKSAFRNCLSLKNINLDDVQHIDSYAFFNCKKLDEVNLRYCILDDSSFSNSIINKVNAEKCNFYVDSFQCAYINTFKLQNVNIFTYAFNASVVNNLIISDNAEPDFDDENFNLSAITINDFRDNIRDFTPLEKSKAVKVYNKLSYYELINLDYSESQINQILLGYNDDILLNMFPPSTDVSVFRLVREKMH